MVSALSEAELESWEPEVGNTQNTVQAWEGRACGKVRVRSQYVVTILREQIS